MIFGSGRRRVIPTSQTETSNAVDSVLGDDEQLPKLELDDDDDLEPWMDWIKRTTHDVEAHMNKLHIDCWTSQARRKKWRWAQRVIGFTADRWAIIAAKWEPELHMDGQVSRARRRQSRPKLRWSDDITSFLSKVCGHENSWLEVPSDSPVWAKFEQQFVNDDWADRGAQAAPST